MFAVDVKKEEEEEEKEEEKSETAKFNYKHSINLLNALLRFRHHSQR